MAQQEKQTVMKVTVKETKQQEIKFPCLMYNEVRKAFIIAVGMEEDCYKGLAIKADWADFEKDSRQVTGGYHPTAWKPYDGTIELSND